MRLSDWKANSRYNALHLSSLIPKLIHKLVGLGMIELSKGGFGGAGNPEHRTSRIVAAKPQIAMFEGHLVPLNELEPPRSRELVILRDENNKEMEYEDTPETKIYRAVLTRYNELLWSSFIDLPTFDKPFRRARDQRGTGPVPLSCRSDYLFMQPLLRRPRGFSSPKQSVFFARCRSRLCS